MVDINCCEVLWPRSTVTTIRSETNFDRFSGLDIDHVDCCIVLVKLNHQTVNQTSYSQVSCHESCKIK